MSSPTVPYKILADGYEVESSQQGGYRAVVPYLVAWADAFAFHDQIMLAASAQTVGLITFSPPYLFPAAPNAHIYAASARIEPVGSDGLVYPAGYGLVPGEVFLYAKITVVFEALRFPSDFGNDPGNLHQLDPANPITMCVQTVQMSGRSETRPREGYRFDGDPLAPPPKDPSILVTEAEIILDFPLVPFLPWKKVRPYLNTLNIQPIFDCPVGTALLAGTNITPGSNTQGRLSQQVQFRWLVQDDDWNHETKDDGTRDKLHKVGATSERPYKYKDHREIFLT
jgi:hypothetical protein